jgi:flagellar biosynthetic protein FliR
VEFSVNDVMRLTTSLMWPLLRVGSFVLASPILGARSISVRTRVILTVAIAWILAPITPAPEVNPLSAAGLLISLQQVALGLGMGFIFHMAFATVVIAGQSIAMAMGLGFASAVDPQNGVQVPVVSQFYMILATLVFLAIDGHLLLLQTIHHSFELLPVGAQWPHDLAWKIVQWGSQMFVSGLLIALPALASLLLVNLAFGVITRSAPQLNIFAVGFPITLLAGFALILLSLPSFLPLISGAFESVFKLAPTLLVP